MSSPLLARCLRPCLTPSAPTLRRTLKVPGSDKTLSRFERTNKFGLEVRPEALENAKKVNGFVPAAWKGDGLFQEVAQKFEEEARQTVKSPTFHKSSTAQFKASRRKMNDISRLIAGRSVDEGVLQLKVSPKRAASRILSMVALARDHALAKGLDRSKLVIAQSWVTKGPYLRRIDIKGRGRHGIKHHPSSRVHVLLAEGKTKEVKAKEHEADKFRRMVKGDKDHLLSLSSRKIVNTGVGQWRV